MPSGVFTQALKRWLAAVRAATVRERLSAAVRAATVRERLPAAVRAATVRERLPAADLPSAKCWLPILLWIPLSGLAAALAAESTPAERATFSILSEGRKIGTEKFEIAPVASGWEATGEIQLELPGGPRVTETSSLRLDPNFQPTSYERRQKSPKPGSVSVQFGKTETTLTSTTEAGTETQVFFLPGSPLAVLDTNFFHHYALWLRQYDPARSGPQHFNVFVPQEATPGTISLELQGLEKQTVGKISVELNHFRAVTEDVKIEIWATPEGAIYRLSIPQANLEIIRE